MKVRMEPIGMTAQGAEAVISVSMPSGVEHAWSSISAAMWAAVISVSMPSGVEHTDEERALRRRVRAAM